LPPQKKSKKKKDIEKFARSPEGMELATICLDLGYKLAESAGRLTRDQISFLLTSLKIRKETAEATQLEDEGVTRIVFKDDEEVE
jgi:hypothetical protein